MITPHNIFRHELIGLNVEIVESSHQELVGIKGKVIDETRNTLCLEKADGKEIVIAKNTSVFQFQIPEGSVVEIEGKVLVSRPEDRIKKKFKKI